MAEHPADDGSGVDAADRVGTANATFAATLVDQLARCGLTHAFVAPGSRSTPIAVALADRTDLRVEMMLDERSAAFAALGCALQSRRPAIAVCTSGTAATHFHGAVAEAGISRVPLIVCTANRPPELWGVGAPQTIDQTDLYGVSGATFHRSRPPDDTDPSEWRELANTVWAAALSPGPVQLDCPFREPLWANPESLPAPIPTPSPPDPPGATADDVADVVATITRRGAACGVVVAGRGESDPQAIADVADRLGWPVIADHRSGARTDGALRRFDTILRDADGLRTGIDHVLYFGETLSSKVLSQTVAAVAAGGGTVHRFVPWSRTIDPERCATAQIPERLAAAEVGAALHRTSVARVDGWRERWVRADRSVVEQQASLLEPGSEPAVAAHALADVPRGGALVVSSSMPVRDLEWFGPPRSDVAVHSNRGANGIDGVLATAIGVATTGVATLCLVGDVALVHDSSSLAALSGRSVDLTIVVVDNDGGGIFHFLPQRTQLPAERFEQLFGTPHRTDLHALAAAHGIAAEPYVADLDLRPHGVRLVVAATDRVGQHDLRQRLAAVRPIIG